ncbi:MAG: ribonuclease H-like domain-containing protein [Lachnospiraceae bacterium]|nr:ribonuclease H-like domain-containing protein [Lachnospiraceae bacterium]
MQIITKEWNTDANLRVPEWIDWDSSLCIDIETTGLSPASSFLYLIGCTYISNGCFYVKQWFSEGIDQEEQILKDFCEWASGYRCLIHFNGSTFDIPYLSAKCKKYGLEPLFEGFEQLDIYKRLYPYRRFFPIPNLKQKTVEGFLGIGREDLFSGGELIPVYTAYVGRLRYESCVRQTPNTGSFDSSSRNARDFEPEQMHKALQTEGRLPHIPADVLKEALLGHNREDVGNLPKLLQMLSYAEAFRGHLTLETARIEAVQRPSAPVTDGLPDMSSELILKLHSELMFPVSFAITAPLVLKSETACCCRISFEGNLCTLTVPVYQGEVRHYYENYKDYYYLIEEGIVSHKSVAGFVSAKYRRKAKPEECCYKKAGRFLPQPENTFEPYYYKEYKDRFSWFELTAEFKNDPKALTRYAKELLLCLTGQTKNPK